jgi:hypothetical protein
MGHAVGEELGDTRKLLDSMPIRDVPVPLRRRVVPFCRCSLERRITMKDGIRNIVGKTISGVVVKEADRLPRSQIYLLFSDGTYFEIYSGSGDMSGAGGVDVGGIEEVRRYMSATHRIVIEEPAPEGSST